MKALILDTNFSSFPLYQHLKTIGFQTYVMGNRRDDYLAGFKDAYVYGDYSSYDLVCSIIDDLNIDIVIPGCNDHSYSAWSILPHNKCHADSPEVIEVLHNKGKFRMFCNEHGIPAPRSYLLSDFSVDFVNNALIVKPADSFSGKGITKIPLESISSLLNDAVVVAQNASFSNEYVIEDYIEGQLFSHSCFLRDKKIEVDFFVREYGVRSEYAVDLSFVDYDLPSSIKKDFCAAVEKMAQILDLKDGLLHTQFIYTKGEFWFIEVTRRCPGDLYSLLIKASTGFDYAAAYVESFFGEKIKTSHRIFTGRDQLTQKFVIRNTMTGVKSGIFSGVSYSGVSTPMYQFLRLPAGRYVTSKVEDRVGISFFQFETANKLEVAIDRFLEDDVYKVLTDNEVDI